MQAHEVTRVHLSPTREASAGTPAPGRAQDGPDVGPLLSRLPRALHQQEERGGEQAGHRDPERTPGRGPGRAAGERELPDPHAGARRVDDAQALLPLTHDRVGRDDDAPPGEVGAPAEVQPLHPVSIEGLVETLYVLERRAAHQRARQGDAQHVLAQVELPLVDEGRPGRIGDPAGWREVVPERAQQAGLVGAHELGPDDTDAAAASDSCDQRCQGAGIRPRIGSEEPEPVAVVPRCRLASGLHLLAA